MRRTTPLVGVLALITTVACYHATVETGLAPGTQTIEQNFASGWIYGLIPPKTVSTAARCPGGVARVETQLSFVNQLVTFITAGIYTPMTIKVTCSGARADAGSSAGPRFAVRADAPNHVIQAVFEAAATAAVAEGKAAQVEFTPAAQPSH